MPHADLLALAPYAARAVFVIAGLVAAAILGDCVVAIIRIFR